MVERDECQRWRLLVAMEVEAVSESAARQAWVDGAVSDETLVDVERVVDPDPEPVRRRGRGELCVIRSGVPLDIVVEVGEDGSAEVVRVVVVDDCEHEWDDCDTSEVPAEHVEAVREEFCQPWPGWVIGW